VGTLEITFSADHPAARGHFPGNPIVPGAVLLSEAVRAVGAAAHVDLSRCSVSAAKFPSPSRPGDRVDVAYSMKPDSISLTCSVSGRVVLKAEVACIAKATAT
jgi:3-hydroxymyristoyl/3-hydroxydecanoyl-(acyl carrier protein) dehydratase